MKEIVVAIQQSSASMFGALVPALTQKPPDNSGQMYEMIKMNQDSQRGIVEAALKRDNRENSMQQQMFQALLHVSVARGFGPARPGASAKEKGSKT